VGWGYRVSTSSFGGFEFDLKCLILNKIDSLMKARSAIKGVKTKDFWMIKIYRYNFRILLRSMHGFIDLRKGILAEDEVQGQYTFSQVNKAMHCPKGKG